MAMSHDGLFEILSWLPAKSIHRFKPSAKLLCEFTEETYFALKQAYNMLKKEDPCFFIQPDIGQRYNDRTELHPLPGEELFSGVSNDVTRFLSSSAKILASSNGLILCRAISKSPTEMFISNPATQSWLPIPIPEHMQDSPDADLKIAFECNHGTFDSDDYKVFLFDNPSDWSSNFGCHLYLPKEGVWKATETSFDNGGRNMRFDMPVHHNGAIHFISDCFPYFNKRSPYFRPYIMAYDVENRESRILRVPKEARRGSHDHSCDMRIFKWGNKVNSSDQSICLVRLRKKVFTAWELIECKSSSWRKVLKVRVKAMGMTEQDPVITGFTVLNGDSLVFATQRKVYRYGLNVMDERFMVLEELCKHGFEYNYVCFTSYSDTLRPCGTGASTMPYAVENVPHDAITPNFEDAITPNIEVVPLISVEEQQHNPFVFLFAFLFVFLFVCGSILS